MTYTLDMASDLEPRIADDGVQEVPLTKARALLTRLIEQAREEGLVSALTVRGRRRIYLVTPDYVFRAQAHADVTERLRRLSDSKPFMDALEQADPDLHYLLDTGAI
ncbi:hypothetical protein ACFWJU_05965 [Streptomyces mutabilis]|uniref:hypothetical protein n=1 Tax=Streptomyces mutabilis TaxID=67332 RepID=UPI0036644ACE